MAKVTNISGGPRALPLVNREYVEFANGETKDFPDADWLLLAERDDVKACFTADDVSAPSAPAPKAKKVSIKDAD